MNARGHLSSETIDLLLLSALADAEATQARAHLDGCDECRGRWAQLEADKRQFEQFVFPRTLPKLEARLEQQQTPVGFFARFRLAVVLPAVAVAAAATFAVVGLTGPGTQTEDELYIGLKGAVPSVEIVAQRGETQFKVTPGGELHAKDRIRFVVNPAGARYVLIASQDGAGAFTVYQPFGANQSMSIEGVGRARVELPGAVELDDTMGTERVVAAFSDSPISAADLEAAFRADPAAPRLPNARVVTWDFEKAP